MYIFQGENIVLSCLRRHFFQLTVGDLNLILCGWHFCLSFATAAFLRRAEASRSCQESVSFQMGGLRSFEIRCLDCGCMHIKIPASGYCQYFNTGY